MDSCKLRWLLVGLCVISTCIGFGLTFFRERIDTIRGISGRHDGKLNPGEGSFAFSFSTGLVLILIGLAGAYYFIDSLSACEPYQMEVNRLSTPEAETITDATQTEIEPLADIEMYHPLKSEDSLFKETGVSKTKVVAKATFHFDEKVIHYEVSTTNNNDIDTLTYHLAVILMDARKNPIKSFRTKKFLIQRPEPNFFTELNLRVDREDVSGSQSGEFGPIDRRTKMKVKALKVIVFED
jgi:hypothetical protein